jgi:hypothetical protein
VNKDFDLVLSLPQRQIFYLTASAPAVYYLHDAEVGGILINTPPFDNKQLEVITALGGLAFIFYPSFLGVQDFSAWKNHTGAEVLANPLELATLGLQPDIALDHKSKLTRTIDFLPMSGRTVGSMAMRLKNQPAVLFFGPILSPNAEGVLSLVPQVNDYSWENRVFGSLGLQDLTFEYAFSDVFDKSSIHYGPQASVKIHRALAALW